MFRGILDYDWPGSEAAFRRAFELSPGAASLLSNRAWLHLVPRLQLAQALDQAQQAVALDPLSPFMHGRLGLVRVAARQYGLAVEACRRAVELASGLWWLHWFHATALFAGGRRAEALRQALLGLRAGSPTADRRYGVALWGLSRRRKRAKEVLVELEAMARRGYVPPSAFALAFVGLGDERAFERLEKAIDARDPAVTHLPSMPLYDGLRGDPRFPDLLARIHLT